MNEVCCEVSSNLKAFICANRNENLRNGGSIVKICRNYKRLLFVLSSSSCYRDLVNDKNNVENQEQERKGGDDNVVDDKNSLLPSAGNIAGYVGILKKVRKGLKISSVPQSKQNGPLFQHRICILPESAKLLS